MNRLLAFLLFIPCVVHAQDHEIACYSFPKATESYKKKLWDGYEISLGPARNATDAGEDACTGAIYNKAGKVVFRTTGFGVRFDDTHTGMDFDGDGKGEVVFMTDVAGGAHCCWVYNVVTLAPKPHKLFDVGEGTAVYFQKDPDGRMIITELVGGTTNYTASVDRPYAQRIYRVQGGKLVDSTPEFCGKIFTSGSIDYDEWNKTLTAENLKKLQSATKFGPGADFALDPIISALLSRAMQRVLCRQFDEAMADLNLWPEDSRDDMKDDFAVSIKTYSAEFAARLAGVAPKK